MWLVKNKDGVLLLYENKPTRAKDGWSGGGKSFVIGEFPVENPPSFVTLQEWKDAPLQVKFELKKK